MLCHSRDTGRDAHLGNKSHEEMRSHSGQRRSVSTFRDMHQSLTWSGAVHDAATVKYASFTIKL